MIGIVFKNSKKNKFNTITIQKTAFNKRPPTRIKLWTSSVFVYVRNTNDFYTLTVQLSID